MRISVSYLFILFFSSFSFAQFGFNRIDTINVVNGSQQQMPWSGGIDYAQLSNIDLNWDGVDDLFIFDRTCNKVLTFVHDGTVGAANYTYAPQYESLFPKLIDWAFLVDYNCDGKEDIFTYNIGQIKVFKNVGDAVNGHNFQLVTDALKGYNPLANGEFGIPATSIDIPCFVDIDGDSDIDFLNFETQGFSVEYHKNLSMENYGSCDSLDYELKNLCWGKFRESATDNQINLNSTDGYCDPVDNVSNPESWVPDNNVRAGGKHSGGTTTILDMDGDGVMDILIGDISDPNITMLINGGTAPNTNSAMISKDTMFPSNSIRVDLDIMPGVYHVDINNDSKRDIAVSPALKIGSENRQSMWYYENTNTDSNPTFNYVQNDFLQGEMIDNGSSALPVFFDHNGDGLLDLLVSVHDQYNPSTKNYISKIQYYENTGTAQQAEFTLITDDYQNLSSKGIGNSRVFYPAFGDLDADGDKDMILGEYLGYLYFFENTGGAGNPAIFNTYVTLEDDNSNAIFESTFAFPELVDLDRDGDLDLVLGKRSGKLSYYENIGNANFHVFSEVTTNLGGVDVSEWWTVEGHSVPKFLDLNGQYHLLLGSKSGYIHYYDNIEGNINGTWNQVDSSLQDIYIGTFSAPAIADVNNDNHFEMVLGNKRGGLGLYKSVSISNIGMNENTLSNLKIYPNPGHDKFYIELGETTMAELNKVQIQMIDISGRIVREISPKSHLTEVNADNLSKGTYLIRIQSGNDVQVKKLLLQ